MGWFLGYRLSDRRLRDFNFLTSCLDRMYPTSGWARTPDEIAITVANRLANLVDRMERTPCNQTAGAARWYIYNMELYAGSRNQDAVSLIVPLQERLWAAIRAYETRVGYDCKLAATEFGQLVGQTETERCSILYGPLTTTIWHQSFPIDRTTPRGRLITWISFYCWHCIDRH
jgi:hypothetical protein